jgi:hypothetical protein
MQRRTAIAAASAISVSLLSGVVAMGAHLGALGFSGTPATSTGQPIAAVTAPARVTDQTATTVAQHERDDARTSDDRHVENDRDDESPAGAQHAGTRIGTDDD